MAKKKEQSAKAAVQSTEDTAGKKSAKGKAASQTAEKSDNTAPAKQRDTEKKRKYTLEDCMNIGRLGNIMFVVFIVVCLIYYYSFARKGSYVIPFEVVAYGIEATGFALFTLSVIWIDRLVRARTLMKVLLIVYIVVEVVLMLLEFQFLPWIFYNGLSKWTIIGHVIFSACVSFSLLMLEPHNKRLEIIVGITTGVILAGMFFAAAGYRVYASILVNTFAYIFFFTAMKRLLILEEVLVDCYGDQAKVTQFESTFFADTPTMIERERPATVKERVKAVKNRLSLENEEKLVLTDKDEKFEYEFGVIEDDDDDDDDDEYEDASDEDGDGE